MTPRSLAYLGNFEPPYSTENEYLHAFRAAGHTVEPVQEGDAKALVNLLEDIRRGSEFDFVLWTRTKGLADRVGDAGQWELAHTCRRANIPLVGVHLDVWIGLAREQQIPSDPYFKACDVLFTADGGHQDEWKAYGVNHQWLLPAISERWVGLGEPRDEYRSKIAFVGSWQGGYHREATHRHQLIRWLQRTYPRDLACWPAPGQHAIRGRALNDLYASVDVIVGDSCNVDGAGYYCSDRIPETYGRGGLLLHPRVVGINQDPTDPFYLGDLSWDAGDWGALKERIAAVIEQEPAVRDFERLMCVEVIRSLHTYTHRADQLLMILQREGVLNHE